LNRELEQIMPCIGEIHFHSAWNNHTSNIGISWDQGGLICHRWRVRSQRNGEGMRIREDTIAKLIRHIQQEREGHSRIQHAKRGIREIGWKTW
jgi:hypothetical protein